MVPVALALIAAAPVRLGYVVELASDAMRGDVDAAVAALVDERVGVELVTRSVFDAQLRTCGADVECLARELRYDDVDFVALVVGAPVGGEVRLVSRVVDTRRAEIVARDARTSAAPIDDALRASFEALLDALRIERVGRLAIGAPADADVRIEDASGHTVAVGVGPHALAPGPYRVSATRADHSPYTRDVTVEGGHLERIEVAFVAEDPGWYTSPWFWVVSAGVVIGGALVGVAAATAGGERCVCFGRDLSQCPPPC